MNNKLIIYADASFKHKKCGWSYLYYLDNKPDAYTICYGNNKARTSAQAEIVACIRAIENININIEILGVEIRSDSKVLVDIMNRILYGLNPSENFRDIHHKTWSAEYKMILTLLKIIILKGYIVSFEKANRNEAAHHIVHRYSRIARFDTDYDDSAIYNVCLGLTSPNKSKRVFINISEAYRKAKEVKDLSLLELVEGNQTIEINLKDVLLLEPVHLRTVNLELLGRLEEIKRKGKLYNPIVVRKKGNRYALVGGFTDFCLARIIGLEKVDAIITNLMHDEYKGMMLGCIKL